MESLTHSLLVVIVLLQVAPVLITGKSDPLIKVTDDNWKVVLEGEWMVEFMAPWCPACRSFQSTWQSLAEWSRDLDINVGVIDVTENPGLSGRFLVTSLPTVLHVKDGVFRTYSGPRKESDLLSFVDDKKWQDIEPVSSWINPNSIQMGAVGFFFKVAMVIRTFYNMMVSEYGIPEWGCYIIFAVLTIIVGLLLGLMFVLCCDWLFPPKYVPSYSIPITKDSAEEDDRDDESDVIEDTSPDQEEVVKDDAGDTTVRRRQKANKEAEEAAEKEAS